LNIHDFGMKKAVSCWFLRLFSAAMGNLEAFGRECQRVLFETQVHL